MWQSEYAERGGLRVSPHVTRDTAAFVEGAYAEVLTEHGFARGAASPCSFYSKERGIRAVVQKDDFLSAGPRSQLTLLEKVMHGQTCRGEAHHDVRVKRSCQVDRFADSKNVMEKFWDSARAGHETR